VTSHRSPVQRRVIAEIERIDIGALLEQILDGVIMPIMRRALERGILHQTALLDIGALVEQELDHLCVSVTRGEHERRITAVIGFIQRCAFMNVFLYPIVVSIDAIPPDVGLFWDKSTSLLNPREVQTQKQSVDFTRVSHRASPFARQKPSRIIRNHRTRRTTKSKGIALRARSFVAASVCASSALQILQKNARNAHIFFTKQTSLVNRRYARLVQD
jgi:hypothetical protein